MLIFRAIERINMIRQNILLIVIGLLLVALISCKGRENVEGNRGKERQEQISLMGTASKSEKAFLVTYDHFKKQEIKCNASANTPTILISQIPIVIEPFLQNTDLKVQQIPQQLYIAVMKSFTTDALSSFCPMFKHTSFDTSSFVSQKDGLKPLALLPTKSHSEIMKKLQEKIEIETKEFLNDFTQDHGLTALIYWLPLDTQEMNEDILWLELQVFDQVNDKIHTTMISVDKGNISWPAIEKKVSEGIKNSFQSILEASALD